jgi:hypothetical protein
VFGAVLALACAAAFAGCSQEGRTIQNPVVVQGIASDVSARTRSVVFDSTSMTSDTTWVMDVNLKVQVSFRNRCEAEKTGLEIHLEGPTNLPVFVVTPIARYEADDACNIGATGDTVISLRVQTVSVTNNGTVSFAIRGDIPTEIPFVVDKTLPAFVDSTTRYEVKVEDQATGAALSGAIVRIERADTTELIGETTTDANGKAVVSEDLVGACSSTSAPPLSTPYTLKVTYSGRTTILRMRTQPARCGAVERAIVRV